MRGTWASRQRLRPRDDAFQPFQRLRSVLFGGSLRMPGGTTHRSGETAYNSSQLQWHDEEYQYQDGRSPTGADPFGLGGDRQAAS